MIHLHELGLDTHLVGDTVCHLVVEAFGHTTDLVVGRLGDGHTDPKSAADRGAHVVAHPAARLVAGPVGRRGDRVSELAAKDDRTHEAQGAGGSDEQLGLVHWRGIPFRGGGAGLAGGQGNESE